MDKLAEKFDLFEKKVALLKEQTRIESEKIERPIEKAFDFDHQTFKINSKRAELLTRIDRIEQNIFKIESMIEKKCLLYLKNGKEELKERKDLTRYLLLFTKFDTFGRLFFRNELSLYKKLFYFDVYNIEYTFLRHQATYVDNKQSKINCINIDRDRETYLMIDLVKRQLSLLDRKFQILKQFNIGGDYYLSCFDLVESKLVFLFNNLNHSACFVYVLDFNFCILKFKRLPSVEDLCLQPACLFYKCPATRNFYILDYELSVLQFVPWKKNRKREYGDLEVLQNASLVLAPNKYLLDMSDFSTNEYKIVSLDTNVNRFIVEKSEFEFRDYINVVKMDPGSKYLYFIRTWARMDHDRANLFCYECASGKFVFKRHVPAFEHSNAIYFDHERMIVV
jgi:hypothetical protein